MKKVWEENKKLITVFILVIVLSVVAIGACFATDFDLIQPNESAASNNSSNHPMISNKNVMIIGDQKTIHDLTDVEWDGLKGVRGKQQLIEYISKHPDCTLTEAMNEVKGFGPKSAEIIEEYLRNN